MSSRRTEWTRETALNHLRVNYRKPEQTVGFASPITLYNYYKKALTHEEIREFLQAELSYASKFPFRKPTSNPTFIYSVRAHIEIDHIDVTSLRSDNSGFGYILMVHGTYFCGGVNAPTVHR